MADGDEWENEMNSDDAGEAVSGGAGDLVPTERKRVQSHNGSDSYEPELLTAMGKNKRRRESNNDDSQEDRDRAIDKEIEQHEALMKHYLLPSPNDNQRKFWNQTSGRMKLDQIVDKRFTKAWKAVGKYLNYREKYNLFNTAKYFRYTIDLCTSAHEELESIQLDTKNKMICRSYGHPKWSFYRSYSWITEQHCNSKWTQWKFFFRERRHPSVLAILAKDMFSSLS